MKVLLRISLCALAAFVGATSSSAQVFSTPVRISGTTAAHSPMAQFARNGDLYASWYANAADIYFARSTDRGATFTPPIRVTRQVTNNIYTSLLQRTPRSVVDTKGVIHMVWTEERVNSQNDVWYVRSTDRGDTWSSPVSIMDPDDSAKYPQDFCNIACDSSDRLYVAYLDFRGVVRGIADYAQLHLTKSANGGATWSTPVVANKFRNNIGGTCECCKLDIAVTRKDVVHIAFRSNITNERDIWLARSRDGGVTFDSTIHVQSGTWTIGGCPTTGPSIALDAMDNLYFAWRDSRDDSVRAIAYYSMLPDGQDKPYLNRSTSRPGLQNVNWPSLAVSRANGAIAFAYQAGSSSRNRFTYSSDGGNSWTQDMPFPNALGGEQSLPVPVFSANGDAAVVWQEGGNNGAIYASALTSLPIAAPLQAASPFVLSNPSEPGQPTPIYWHPTPAGSYVWYEYRLSAIGGDTLQSGVTRDTTVLLNALSEGQYVFTLTTHASQNVATTNIKITKSGLGVLEFVDGRPRVRVTYSGDAVAITWSTQAPSNVKLVDLLGRVVLETSAIGHLELSRSQTRALTAGRYTAVIELPEGTAVVPVLLGR